MVRLDDVLRHIDCLHLVGELEGDVGRMQSKVEELVEKSHELASLKENLGLQDKINEIRKRIEMSRTVANSVSLPCFAAL